MKDFDFCPLCNSNFKTPLDNTGFFKCNSAIVFADWSHFAFSKNELGVEQAVVLMQGIEININYKRYNPTTKIYQLENSYGFSAFKEIHCIKEAREINNDLIEFAQNLVILC